MVAGIRHGRGNGPQHGCVHYKSPIT
jgi:hypothetical protein